ncbi:MAG: hypothetical protein FJW34_14800 [Acidobacteria bacterium]|nr:hypothetical protein [Acidobacteriota bacterium]
MPGIVERLDQLGKEVEELKRAVFPQRSPKRRVSLKGALRGVKISEKDIREAQRSLFPPARVK